MTTALFWKLILPCLFVRKQCLQFYQKLFVTLREEWNNLTVDYVRRLVLSMRRRVTALFEARGGHTRY